MNEFKTLTPQHQSQVVGAVEEALKGSGGLHECGQAYAYIGGMGCLSWGVNAGQHGFCIARGLVMPDAVRDLADTRIHWMDGLLSDDEFPQRMAEILAR